MGDLAITSFLLLEKIKPKKTKLSSIEKITKLTDLVVDPEYKKEPYKINGKDPKNK
ncbi:MAG: hypothetical protein K8Q91_00140 [Candidatus Vogelbacteria bacterium]|nr:hypothetical protein [Candidatus Vogelbacteria bacterium]